MGPALFSDLSDWANAVWLGFDSGEPAPASFVRFVRAAALADGISLFALRSRQDGDVAATGLLCARGGTGGVYYVSTRPEHRRRGLGLRVMRALTHRAGELGCAKASLLATGAGRPLYLKCGFRETSRVTIMLRD
jgi:GNAT superfamily N-acetyltransferase